MITRRPAGRGRYKCWAPCPRLIGSCWDLASPSGEGICCRLYLPLVCRHTLPLAGTAHRLEIKVWEKGACLRRTGSGPCRRRRHLRRRPWAWSRRARWARTPRAAWRAPARASTPPTPPLPASARCWRPPSAPPAAGSALHQQPLNFLSSLATQTNPSHSASLSDISAPTQENTEPVFQRAQNQSPISHHCWYQLYSAYKISSPTGGQHAEALWCHKSTAGAASSCLHHRAVQIAAIFRHAGGIRLTAGLYTPTSQSSHCLHSSRTTQTELLSRTPLVAFDPSSKLFDHSSQPAGKWHLCR